MRIIRRGKLANREAKIASRIASVISAKYSNYRRFNMKRSGSFLQRCNGKCKLETSNSNTDQMDIDQATRINFQEELIMEILSRLPVRSLLQFKCVSKLWNTLISDPYFKRIHLKHAKNDQNFQKFLICHCPVKDNIYSCYCSPLSPVQIIEDAQKLVLPSSSKPLFGIECSLDGLVMVSVYENGIHDHQTFMLWNPSTNESIVLPHIELPESGLFLFGMGYDSSIDDYKILGISTAAHNKGHCESTGQILALKAGAWRKIDRHPHGIRNMLDYTHVLAFVHEAFHWISASKKFSLISFDISNEIYGEIPLPEEILMGKFTLGVSVLDGMLCAYSARTDQGLAATFKVWVMKEYGVKDTWNAILTMKDPFTCIVVPKYRFADGEVLFWCGCHLPTGGNAFRTPSGPFMYWQHHGFQNGLVFTESLISPKSLTY